MNQLEKTGYVNGSTVEIWTQVDQSDAALETLNILHIHVNDTSDQVTFDVAYMHEGESLSQFMDFSKDLQGRPLKYKIIAKDAKVHAVLYNMNIAEKESTQIDEMLGKDPNAKAGVKEIPFAEYSFQVGDLLFSTDKFNKACSQSKFLAQIESIPTGLITSADFNKVQNHLAAKLRFPMKCYCDARSLDELLGYVDLNMMGQLDAETEQIMPIQVASSEQQQPNQGEGADKSTQANGSSGNVAYNYQAHTICSFTRATKE